DQIKFGVDFRRLFPTYGPLEYVQGYNFNGVAGITGGTASSISLAAPSTINHSSHSTNVSTFAQDTWASTPALTLTYGVRWEINPPPGLSDNGTGTTPLTLTNTNPSTIAFAPAGTPMYQTTYDNIAPRVGAAYRLRTTPGREMVLRGGWGIFFDLGSNAVMENLANSYPFTARRILANAAFPTSSSLLSPPTVVPGSPVDFLTAADPELELPYTNEWNAAVEQAFGATGTITASYVGAYGRRLLRQERLGNPTPQIQQLTLGTNHGHSRYNALQIKYARRLSRGLQALASYTLASSMDNVSSDVIPAIPSYRVDPEQDWAPSDYDVRHTFSGGVTYAI